VATHSGQDTVCRSGHRSTISGGPRKAPTAARGAAQSGGYFACPDSADSTARDRRAASEPPECHAPHIARRLAPEAGRNAKSLAPAGIWPLCWVHGNFPESGKFPAPPGSSPPSDTQTRAFPRFSSRLNTWPCDLPIWGEITGLRGQAALQAPGWAGNPLHCITAFASGPAVRVASLLAVSPGRQH
jgi:hypothetical protein